MTKFVKDLNRKPELVKAGRGGNTLFLEVFPFYYK